MRPSGRLNNQIRPLEIISNVAKYAHGSCLVKVGNTHVLCTATIDDNVPKHIKGTNSGWITAEYGMLPGSTSTRFKREATHGKQAGRTIEIQRLIGRSLRNAIDLKSIGEKQIIIDCDVIQADGGTRCASITGGYIALYNAIKFGYQNGFLKKMPILKQIAAISCGIYNDNVIVDLDYFEDSNAQVDSNIIIDEELNIIEVQATAEKKTFTKKQFFQMLEIAEVAICELLSIQKNAVK